MKHDISVPPGRTTKFVAEGARLYEAQLSGTRINPFGDLAHGNIQCNLTPPLGQADFAGLSVDFALAPTRLADGMGGNFAAERGLGRSKVALADALRGGAL